MPNKEHFTLGGRLLRHVEQWLTRLGGLALHLALGIAVGFLLASFAGNTMREGVVILLGIVDGPWPQWITNLANALQIAAPVIWVLAWLLARTWSQRRESE